MTEGVCVCHLFGGDHFLELSLSGFDVEVDFIYM